MEKQYLLFAYTGKFIGAGLAAFSSHVEGFYIKSCVPCAILFVELFLICGSIFVAVNSLFALLLEHKRVEGLMYEAWTQLSFLCFMQDGC